MQEISHWSNHYNRGICKCLYIKDLRIKRQKSADVDSTEIENDEDLTYLTFVNLKNVIFVQVSHSHISIWLHRNVTHRLHHLAPFRPNNE
jgi:hypothetical protein